VNRIFIQEESQEHEAHLRAEGEQYLAAVKELARTKGIEIEGKIREGALYSEILSLAEEKKADVILLGCWKNDQNPRNIISCFYRELMVHAQCSVMLVKEPNIDHIFRQV
jgi:nucleotide-binding universal stress UspA family protein